MLSPTRAVIAALALTACGSSTPSPTPTAATVSPTAYVTATCSAVAQLSRDGVIEGRRLRAGANGVRTIAHDKSVAEAYVSALARDAGKTVTRIRAAGIPNVENGDATAAVFLSSYVRLETTLAAMGKKARSIPTSSDQAFKRATYAVGSSLGSSMQSINAGISVLRNQPLDTVAKKCPSACRSGAPDDPHRPTVTSTTRPTNSVPVAFRHPNRTDPVPGTTTRVVK
jgi:hypothetical protein